DDPAAATTEARKRAVEDAVARARTLAEAAGVELGRILELSEQSFAPPPMPLGAKAYRMEAAADSVPVEAGENTYRVQVNVTFELKQERERAGAKPALFRSRRDRKWRISIVAAFEPAVTSVL